MLWNILGNSTNFNRSRLADKVFCGEGYAVASLVDSQRVMEWFRSVICGCSEISLPSMATSSEECSPLGYGKSCRCNVLSTVQLWMLLQSRFHRSCCRFGASALSQKESISILELSRLWYWVDFGGFFLSSCGLAESWNSGLSEPSVGLAFLRVSPVQVVWLCSRVLFRYLCHGASWEPDYEGDHILSAGDR